MKIFRTIFLILSTFILEGCIQATPTLTVQIPGRFYQIADEIAGNIINGLVRQDYELFSKDFDPKMKAAISPTAMVEVQKLLWNQNGEFQSMQSKRFTEEKGYLIGTYDLSFEKGNITMRVVFSTTEPYQVSGLWFPSN